MIEQIIWHRTAITRPERRGRYRIRNPDGHESVGHFFPETEDDDAGWVTMDFDGAIEWWAVMQ